MISEVPVRPPPICLALVLADAIWQDPGNGKKTILGTFSTIFAETYPAVHPIMAVLVALTDGYGKTKIELELVDTAEEDKALLSIQDDIEFISPLVVMELTFHFPGIQFEHEGEYRFRLKGNGEILMERRLLVTPPPRNPT